VELRQEIVGYIWSTIRNKRRFARGRVSVSEAGYADESQVGTVGSRLPLYGAAESALCQCHAGVYRGSRSFCDIKGLEIVGITGARSKIHPTCRDLAKSIQP
jgi:hypothetical protein